MSASPHTLAMIERFLCFDTTSRGTNLPLIHFVRDFLADLGVESHITYDDTKTKANLFATLGPIDKPGYILSGHTDIVPVDDQPWTCPPHELTIRGTRLFGRGITDMKGFLAIALAQAPSWLERGLETPIHFAMSYDEEVGCLGVPRMIEDFQVRGVQVAGCIVGEPSLMKVVRGHKGKIGCHVSVKGLEAHTGVPHIGVNAIEAAAEAIAYLKSIARRHRDEGPYDHAFQDPPYTTIQHGLIKGGNAVNTVAGHCEFDFDIRFLPKVDPLSIVQELQDHVAQCIVPEMHAVSTETGFEWAVVSGCEALDTANEDDMVALALSFAQTEGTAKVGFGTEAGYFQRAGISTIVCGPGNIDQAHKPDEFMDMDQVFACEQFMSRLADHVCKAKRLAYS